MARGAWPPASFERECALSNVASIVRGGPPQDVQMNERYLLVSTGVQHKVCVADRQYSAHGRTFCKDFDDRFVREEDRTPNKQLGDQ